MLFRFVKTQEKLLRKKNHELFDSFIHDLVLRCDCHITIKIILFPFIGYLKKYIIITWN